MPPTRILILSDGRPGHFNLSEGIAAAIERLGPVQTSRIDIRRGRWSGSVLAALTRARLPPRQLLRLVYGVDEKAIPACDVVVSAGAETLAASIWLARARSVPNIFYGSLRLFSPADFALVLTSYARNADRPRHALALKPSRLDPDKLERAVGHALAAASSGPPTTIGLLLGGDAGPIRYTSADWSDLFNFIVTMHREHGTRWLVANSRRTPNDVSDELTRLAAVEASPIQRFLDVRTAGPGTLPGLLAACDAMICTADSSSMISECIWARQPTVAIKPTPFPLDRDERAYRDWLIGKGWCRELALSDLTPATFQQAVSRICAQANNPLDELAALLTARIPRLQSVTGTSLCKPTPPAAGHNEERTRQSPRT